VSDPNQTDPTTALSRIGRAAGRVELRMRFARVLGVLTYCLLAVIAAVSAGLGVYKIAPKLRPHPLEIAIAIFAVTLVSLIVLIVEMARRLPPRAGSVALDRSHGLADRLTSALEFAKKPASERSALESLAIDDAAEHAGRLVPARAFPLAFPMEMVALVPALLGLFFVFWLEVPTYRVVPKPKTIDALVVAPDDIELFREMAKELERQDQTPEVKAAVDRFNQLVEDLANKRLERTEAFRQLESLETDLLKGKEAEAAALKEQLAETGKQLKDSDLSQKIGDALQKGDMKQAKKELQDLAKKLRTEKKPDKAAIDKLRKALEKASKHRKEALEALDKKRAEMQEQLLKKKKQVEEQKDPNKKREEERLLRKKERELERLDRERERQAQAGSELERLDRELAQAAADLMREMGLSQEDLEKAAQDLEKAAEDLNQVDEKEMSQKEKEELRRRIEELREVLRQQGQGGKKRMARMVKFGKRARGNSGSKGEDEGEGQGQKGDSGEEGEGQEGEGEGKDGEGKDGEGKSPGQGKGGKGGKGEPVLVIGPGGKPMPMPGSGQGQGDQPGGNEPGGEGSGKGGQSYGHGDGGDIAGKATDPKMGTQDVEAQGLEANAGPTNSQVILSAAERGFKGTEYKKVFTQYRTVAEENIQKENIPDGYRFYVQRYFQLIRPRE
jgi:hypothetical protein